MIDGISGDPTAIGGPAGGAAFNILLRIPSLLKSEIRRTLRNWPFSKLTHAWPSAVMCAFQVKASVLREGSCVKQFDTSLSH